MNAKIDKHSILHVDIITVLIIIIIIILEIIMSICYYIN